MKRKAPRRGADFPDTFLPGVARAADREMHAVLAKDDVLREAQALLDGIPSAYAPRGR